jgi:hypothetical protein
MNAVIALRSLARRGALAVSETALLLTFAATLFLSALLLFSIQPIFAKMVLPKLGGSPSVWAVSLVFFQAVLCAGYCYAHLLDRFVEGRQAPLVHICLLALAALALPFGLPAYAAEPPAGDAYFWLIGVLAVGVGLPFFAVSGNAPLLQAWFARSGHPQAADPYFLYGASNLGSLVALLAYPVAIEPMLGLATQSQSWTGVFLLLGFMIAACAALTLAKQDGMMHPVPADTLALGPAGAIDWSQRLHWLILAAVPSGLLVAFTSYVTTDIASAPFLWVIPLAVFLATFMLVFRDKPSIPHHLMLLAQPILVAVTLLGLSLAGNRGWMLTTLAGFGAFFVTTMVCHKELYDQRPDTGRLTEFYLWMSLGGVLGGIFAALVAPQIFNAILEFPLLLVAGLACRPGVRATAHNRQEVQDAGSTALVMTTLVLAFAAAIMAGFVPNSIASGAASLVILVLGVLVLASMGKPLHIVSLSVVMGLALCWLPSAMSSGFSERSFFGVHRVTTTPDGSLRLLMHGTTVHGAQRIKSASGEAATTLVPATYYHPQSPMARGVEAARLASARPAGQLRVGVVGLGSGSLACYARAAEDWRFYEIDPVVVKLASNPQLFNFMSQCRPGADVVLGDARLTLAKEPAGSFDYLVIDAFSSDSVPTHLLTREALQLYLDKLAPNGLLALHVTNRHLDLMSVAGAVATSIPGTYAALADDRPADPGFDAAASKVVFVAKSATALRSVLGWKGVTPMEKSGLVPWSDDFSDILGAILRRYARQ